MFVNSLNKIINRFLRKRVFKSNYLNKIGEGDINLIDIGSAGDLPFPWKENANIIGHLLKFEPRDKPTSNPNITTMDSALWSCDIVKDFYIYKGFKGSGSSLFKQNYEYVRENFSELSKRGDKFLAETWFERSKLVKTEKIQCRSLDNILKDLNHSWNYHFLKIDAQGAEYEILRGAKNILDNYCIGLHLELFKYPLYHGIKLKDEVIDYLKIFNFKLLKKYPAHGSFESQHDCVFIKNGNGELTDKLRSIYKI